MIFTGLTQGDAVFFSFAPQVTLVIKFRRRPVSSIEKAFFRKFSKRNFARTWGIWPGFSIIKKCSHAKKSKCYTCSPVWIYALDDFDMTENSGFDRLLKRYLHDCVSPGERANLEAWLDADKTGGDNGFVWREEDARMLFDEIAANMDGGGERAERTARPRILQWLKMAASVCLLVSGS